jgi:hypothetical protein
MFLILASPALFKTLSFFPQEVYSLSGYGDLSYVSQETFEIAFAMQEQSITETEARIHYLENLINSLKSWLKAIPPTLLEIIQEELDS